MNKILTKTFFLIALIFATHNNVAGQSNDKSKCFDVVFHEKCFFATKGIFDDLRYIKSRPFTKDMSQEKYSLFLKKNTLYLFDICQGVNSKVKITLYDKDENVIATTWDEKNQRFNRAINFYTQSTGEYIISVDFSESQESCIVVVMGMIKKNLDTYIKLPE